MQARREGLRRGQAHLEQQLERLTEAYLAAVVPLAEYRRRRGELEQRRQILEEQYRQLEVQVDRRNELARLAQSMEDFCGRVRQGLAQATFEQKRQLVELLIDRVIVSDGEVEIRYVMPTAPKSEQTRFCHLRLDYRKFPPASPRTRAAHESVQAFQTGSAIPFDSDRSQFSFSAAKAPPHRCPALARSLSFFFVSRRYLAVIVSPVVNKTSRLIPLPTAISGPSGIRNP